VPKENLAFLKFKDNREALTDVKRTDNIRQALIRGADREACRTLL